MEQKQSYTLKRCFGMREAVTTAAGTVIGVGLFTVGGSAVGMQGPFIFFAAVIALLISIYPAMLYAEMGAALPYSGGTYQYASIGLCRPLGMLSGWCFIISMVSVASGEALAFSFYFRTLMRALGLSLPFSDIAIACAAIILFIFINYRGIKLSGRLQNGFMFFFWGVAIVWFFTIIPSMQFASFSDPFRFADTSLSGFLPCVALVWWCFAGFETCCALGEEIKYPQINLPRALLLTPFIVFAVNVLFQWSLLTIVPADALTQLAVSDAPYAEGMISAGIIGFPLILLCAGIAFGGDFSTLNATVSTPARYLFTMARDGVLPKFFAKIHPVHRTPYISVLALGILMIALISTGSIIYIASLSLFATLFFYIIGIISALVMRRTLPDLNRPFKAPFIKILAPVSVIIYLVMMTQLDMEAVTAGLLWCVAGLIIYFICSRKNRLPLKGAPAPDLIQSSEMPDPGEKLSMDREFKRWRNIVAIACFIAVFLYLFAFFK